MIDALVVGFGITTIMSAIATVFCYGVARMKGE